jgi:hypothetical protein
MRDRTIRARSIGGLLAVLALIGLLVVPALAADPSPSSSVVPAAEPTVAPAATAAPTEKPGSGPKPSKGPEVDVTATGTVGTRTAGNGRTEYTLTTGSTVRVLSAGPPWFWGDDHPLARYVGQRVTVAGTSPTGDDEIDVVTVNGTAIREPGRPPWAGGWKAVGERHPGSSQEKADRWKAMAEAKGVDCWPPGHCKEPGSEPSGD